MKVKYKIGDYIKFIYQTNKYQIGKVVSVKKKKYGKNKYWYIGWKILYPINHHSYRTNGIKVEDNLFLKSGHYRIEIISKDDAMVELL